jgi:hypothetical protein
MESPSWPPGVIKVGLPGGREHMFDKRIYVLKPAHKGIARLAFSLLTPDPGGARNFSATPARLKWLPVSNDSEI